MSSCELARHLDVTQTTAWFMIKRIQNCGVVKGIHTLDGVIQMDETFVGGKNKNRHKNKKVAKSQGRSFKDKTHLSVELGVLSLELFIVIFSKSLSRRTCSAMCALVSFQNLLF